MRSDPGCNYVSCESRNLDTCREKNLRIWPGFVNFQVFQLKQLEAIYYLFGFPLCEVVFGWKRAPGVDPNLFHTVDSLVNPFELLSVFQGWIQTSKVVPDYGSVRPHLKKWGKQNLLYAPRFVLDFPSQCGNFPFGTDWIHVKSFIFLLLIHFLSQIWIVFVL